MNVYQINGVNKLLTRGQLIFLENMCTYTSRMRINERIDEESILTTDDEQALVIRDIDLESHLTIDNEEERKETIIESIKSTVDEIEDIVD